MYRFVFPLLHGKFKDLEVFRKHKYLSRGEYAQRGPILLEEQESREKEIETGSVQCEVEEQIDSNQNKERLYRID